MKTHRVVRGAEGRAKIVQGAGKLAWAVGSTIGPSGQTVIIERRGKTPLVTKDGVTVARSITLRDPLESLGAELIKEVASKTNDVSGDGTTTATILANAILVSGHKVLAAGTSPTALKRGMDLATNMVVKELQAASQEVVSLKDIENIGTISANGDREIGRMLAEAIAKVGRHGTITVEPAKSTKTSLEFVSGFQVDTGFWSPYFVTNPEKLVAILEDPYVLITNRKVSTMQDILPLVEKVHQAGKPLLVIVDEIEQEPLNLLVMNRLKGTLQVCVVKAPYYGEYRTEVLQDLAAVTGGEVFDSGQPLAIQNASLEHLGKASRVQVGKTSMVVIGRPGHEEVIQGRAEKLQEAISGEVFQDQGALDRARMRLARLSGGVAVIRVGGVTEPEILEKKDRVDDALNATIAASQEGIVAGGGAALFHAARRVRMTLALNPGFGVLGPEEVAGVKIVTDACEAPLRQIVENTGVSAEVVCSKLADLTEVNNTPFLGYDAALGAYSDMVAEGIIDPVKVTRTALENAVSVAGLLLLCNAVVVEEDDEAEHNSRKTTER